MRRIAHSLLLCLPAGLAGLLSFSCSLRSLQPLSTPSASSKQVREYPLPREYARALHGILALQSSEEIEAALLSAYGVLEDKWSAKKTERTIGDDPVYNNESALVAARKREFDQAEHLLEQAWKAADGKRRLTAPTPFRTAPFALDDRLYDRAPMNPGKDRAILRAFRDFYFMEKRTEREFIDRVMRRTHRFPPQPSLFPGSFATIPIEIVNDWHYKTRRMDLLTWQRFTHLPARSSDGQLRRIKQGLAVNLFIVGVLQGDKDTISRALARLEHNFPGGQVPDRQVQGVLMFGYFVLGDEAGTQRYENVALKPILQP